MIPYFEVQQGSADWLALRLGKPTASEFANVLTPKGKESNSRAFIIRLVTEAVLGRSLESVDANEWMDRGRTLEPEAVRTYEFMRDAETRAVGFVTTDDGRIGASPDRLVGENGLLEIKCPAPQTHIGYLLDGPDGKLGYNKKYRPQVQGQLLVTGRAWCDFFSYSPELPPALVRTERDEPYIALLREALEEFLAERDKLLARVLDAGAVPPRPKQVVTPHEAAYADAGMDWSREDLP